SDLYNINLASHVDRVIEMGATVGEEFSFAPKDHRLFRSALQRTNRFRQDDRKDFFGATAASQTEGEGWREDGLRSLHCAIAPTVCSVHIDSLGFVLSGTDGKYSPDLFQHILHD